MSYEIRGIINQIFPEMGGVGKNGTEWRKKQILIEESDQYKNNVLLQVWGDKIELLDAFTEGMEASFSFNIKSREVRGNWYSENQVFKINK